MKELIKISEYNSEKVVSARELHEILGVITPFNKWVNRKIVANPYFNENEDYIRLDNFVRAGQLALEFVLTLNTAKKVAMSEQTDKGNDVRDYFIECEKIAKEQNNLPDFSNPAIAARAWAEQYEAKMIAEARVKEMKPKAEFAEKILENESSISVANMAKLLKLGQNKLFSMLRDSKVLMSGGQRHNVPYQRYIDAGYFEVTERSWKNEKGEGLTFVTRVTTKGQQYLTNKFG